MYKLYIYERPDHHENQYEGNKSVHLFHAPLMEISSSFIRKSIMLGKDMRYMLPEKVYQYLTEMHFYKKVNTRIPGTKNELTGRECEKP